MDCSNMLTVKNYFKHDKQRHLASKMKSEICFDEVPFHNSILRVLFPSQKFFRHFHPYTYHMDYKGIHWPLDHGSCPIPGSVVIFSVLRFCFIFQIVQQRYNIYLIDLRQLWILSLLAERWFLFGLWDQAGSFLGLWLWNCDDTFCQVSNKW